MRSLIGPPFASDEQEVTLRGKAIEGEIDARLALERDVVLWDQDDRRNSRTGGEKVRDRLRRVRDELEGLGEQVRAVVQNARAQRAFFIIPRLYRVWKACH